MTDAVSGKMTSLKKDDRMTEYLPDKMTNTLSVQMTENDKKIDRKDRQNENKRN